ncbi:hypothetical protein G3545_06090 [Starkeya sp. ORNL1]|uniref:chemotaxis protein CheW n=1 Tax=Starkeya sp. ORNL1 TaxID=2709380 RepID=UPI0014646664|nr:chemotaxis protein CheW [Starkeya sp. ORNL1]QJP13256.1 hypothetical protein G3545_06090 [Starkeya sp. ORNL1]
MDKPAHRPVGGGAGHRRFLTFRIAADFYALPADEVAEVVRVPAVARVPHAPRGLMGIGYLRGSPVPVASLRALLGYEDAEDTSRARAIVLSGAAPVALAVDFVDALVVINSDEVKDALASGVARPDERLKGVFRFHDDRDMAKVLDIHHRLAEVFVPRSRPARAPAPTAAFASPATGNNAADGLRLISFEVADQEYALAIDAVLEIVPIPATLMKVSHRESQSLGVMAYREGLLPLFSLRCLLDLPAPDRMHGSEKVVVAKIGSIPVGIVVDRMRAIIPAEHSMIEPIPAVLAARIGGESRVKAIYRGEAGRRLISILEPESLFREEVMQRLGSQRHDPQRGIGSDTTHTGCASARDVQFLVFRLGEDEYGLPIDAIDEVTHLPGKVTRVPKTPKFLEGVINLRGEVLPVIDQRRRFDLPASKDDTRRRIVVVRTKRHRAGIIVDSVTDILSSSADAIDPAPDLTGEATRLVSGILNLHSVGRIVLILDPAELLTRAERGLLDSFAAKTRQIDP